MCACSLVPSLLPSFLLGLGPTSAIQPRFLSALVNPLLPIPSVTICSKPEATFKPRNGSHVRKLSSIPCALLTGPYIFWDPTRAWKIFSGHLAFTLARSSSLPSLPFALINEIVWFRLTLPTEHPMLMPQAKAPMLCYPCIPSRSHLFSLPNSLFFRYYLATFLFLLYSWNATSQLPLPHNTLQLSREILQKPLFHWCWVTSLWLQKMFCLLRAQTRLTSKYS